jgi:hypothetical protein
LRGQWAAVKGIAILRSTPHLARKRKGRMSHPPLSGTTLKKKRHIGQIIYSDCFILNTV